MAFLNINKYNIAIIMYCTIIAINEKFMKYYLFPIYLVVNIECNTILYLPIIYFLLFIFSDSRKYKN